MKRLLESSRYLTYIAIIALLISTLVAFVWGAINTYKAVSLTITSLGSDDLIGFYLLKVVDVFLVGVVLYLFAASLYGLLIGDLDLPDWLIAHNLHELKARLSSVIILVAALVFLENLIKDKPPLDLLWIALGVAAVSGVLIAFSVLGGKD